MSEVTPPDYDYMGSISPMHNAFVTICMVTGFLIPAFAGQSFGAALVGMVIGVIVGYYGPYIAIAAAIIVGLALIHAALSATIHLFP